MNEQPTDPALMRQACEVMGYEVEKDLSGASYIVTNDTSDREEYDPYEVVYLEDLDDRWDLFGLICEWIEARIKRSELLRFAKNANGGDVDWIVTVWRNGDLFGTSSKAPTLPAASLLWVCEHGAKLDKPTEGRKP